MRTSPAIATALLVAAIASAVAHGAEPKELPLKPDDLTQFYITPDAPSVLTWTAKSPADAAAMRCSVTDYQGKKIPLSASPALNKKGHLELTVTLPAGFYEVEFEGTKQSFGIAAIKPFAGTADPYFGIDSALSWLEKRDDIRDQLIAILKRSGVAISRERMSWTHVSPKVDQYNWKQDNKYLGLRETYIRHQIPVLEMFHDVPPYVRAADTRYPLDLATLATQWPKFFGPVKANAAGVEIWNEPEALYGSYAPADQYAPLVHSIAWASQQAGFNAPIGGGVFMGEDPDDYHRGVRLNGILDQIDFVSFHVYHHAPQIQRLVGKYREWLKECGKETMPLWITESGEAWKTGPDRAPLEQDTPSAVEIVMKAVEAKACGIARYFPFDYPFYEEGGVNSFGMIGREGTPLRSMAGYVNAISLLANQPYAGDLTVDDPAVRLARVFGEGDKRLVVLYTGEPNATATIKLDFIPDEILGLDGRQLKMTADGRCPIPDGMVYLRAAANLLATHLNTHTVAMNLYVLGQQASPGRGLASPIVLQHDATPFTSVRSPTGYLIDEAMAARLHIQLRVWNLSDQPRTVRLAARLPETASPVQDIPLDPIEVAPRSSSQVSCDLDAASSLKVGHPGFVTIVDASDEAPAISPLAIPFRLDGTLAENIAPYSFKRPLDISDISRWENNIVGHGTMTMTSPAPSQWKMDVSFGKPGDRWVFPKLRLPTDLDPATTQAFVIRARTTDAADIRVMLFDSDGGNYWTAMPVILADGKWHVATIPLSQLTPLSGAKLKALDATVIPRLKTISVGISDRSKGLRNTLEISDIVIVGQKT